MKTLETICSRKSIRSYTGEGITQDELKQILTAANASPVGMGRYDEMHLTIVTNLELLRKIDQAGAAMFGKPDIHPLYGAPVLILVSTKTPAVNNVKSKPLPFLKIVIEKTRAVKSSFLLQNTD